MAVISTRVSEYFPEMAEMAAAGLTRLADEALNRAAAAIQSASTPADPAGACPPSALASILAGGALDSGTAGDTGIG